MKFIGARTLFENRFSEVEAHCAAISVLAGETFEVENHVDFERLPQAQGSRALRKTPAAYVPSRRIICINRSTFEPRDAQFQRGVLLHEVAHAFRHRTDVSSEFGDCIGADLTVVSWGLGTEIALARREAYGAEYGDLLVAAATDVVAGTKALEMWGMNVRAGVIPLPSRD